MRKLKLFRRNERWFEKIDIPFFLSFFGLTLFSTFTLAGIRPELLTSQILFFTIAILLFFIVQIVGINFFRKNSILIFLIIICTLFLTLFITDPVRGSRRWIDLGFIRIQPSEIAKPLIFLFFADILSRIKKITFPSFAILGFLILIPFLLILRQPDLGNAIVYLSVYASVMFIANSPMIYFFGVFATATLAAPVIWNYLLKSYQKNRVLSFINPDIDPQGISYNLIQSIITVGSGGFFGQGLGLGTQSRLFFLPENHTDFAYASLIEQFGFVGGITVLVLYGIIIWRLTEKARTYKIGSFEYLFIFSAVFLLFTEVFINAAMNIGLFPVTGITMPLLSYGGSSIISTMLMFGLVFSTGK